MESSVVVAGIWKSAAGVCPWGWSRSCFPDLPHLYVRYNMMPFTDFWDPNEWYVFSLQGFLNWSTA
jgi:hypothetical protein